MSYPPQFRRALKLGLAAMVSFSTSFCASATDSHDAGASDARADDGGAPADASRTDALSGDAAVADGEARDAAHADATSPADAGGDGGSPASASIVATQVCSQSAWALGTLRSIPVGQLASANLTIDDVVWTDGVPAQLPGAGAILVSADPIPDALYLAAETRRVPLIQWAQTDARLERLVGQEVVVVNESLGWAGGPSPNAYRCEVHVDDVTGYLSDAERAEIQQARANPTAVPARSLLLPRPTAFCAVGQEQTSAFALHRNKPHLSLTPRRLYVTRGISTSVQDTIEISHRVGETVMTATGPMASLPSARFSSDQYALADEWSPGGGYVFAVEVPRFELEVGLTAGKMPLVLYDHLTAHLVVTYPAPFDDPDRSQPQTTQWIELWPCTAVDSGAPVSRSIDVLGRGRLDYDLLIGGLSSRQYFTAPLGRMLRAELSGLFAQTIVLTSEDSQSAAADHHNFSENIILEPGREPNLSPAILQLLQTADVKVLYFRVDLALSQPNSVSEAFVQGFDGRWRPL
ncbi:MAG: hypothetical protein IT384_26960 [Deltaproteobacteria bacterium]|nr:hypothetical protein [Deltaproteobacteria bacterium]